jgi:5-methylcytosine-specific restriction endonuclease McrA
VPLRPPTYRPPGSATPSHRRESNRERMAREHHTGVRIRGRKGQEARTLWLTMHPTCAVCERAGRVTQATTVDHVVPVSRGGADDPDNFQSMCDPCHAVKTRDERRR